jgi:hypothetical protein
VAEAKNFVGPPAADHAHDGHSPSRDSAIHPDLEPNKE